MEGLYVWVEGFAEVGFDVLGIDFAARKQYYLSVVLCEGVGDGYCDIFSSAIDV